MVFSKRTDWELGNNCLAQLLASKRSKNELICDLTESNPTRCGFKGLGQRLLKPLSDPKNLIYEPEARGLLEAREAVCRYYAERGVAVERGQVLLTASTSEAYSFLFRLLLDPGETVLAPSPSYPLLNYLTDLNDATLDGYLLRYEDGWSIDFHDLERAVEKKPKALVVINPNNPTGNFVAVPEVKRLAELCQEKGIPIISDEVFLDFAWEPQFPGRSFAAESRVLTFTLSGPSKVAALPQMKLGWIVVSGPADLRNKALERLEVIADTYLSVNTPAQRALSLWLQNSKAIQGEILERIFSNRSALEKIISQNKGIELLHAEGGWNAVLRLLSQRDDEAFALNLLKEKNVLVQPGYLYDFPEPNCLVISLLLPTQTFSEAFIRLTECV